MVGIIAQIHEATWGWWHQLAWGWWLLILSAAVVLAGLALYWAILRATVHSAMRRSRTDGHARSAHGKKLAQRPPHAPLTT